MGRQRAFLAILQERCLGIDSGPYTSQPCDAGFGEERPKPFDTSGRLRSPALLPRTPESNLVAINVNGEPIMSIANRGLLISADAHVAENEDLRARLPERLRERMPLLVPAKGGDHDVETNGEVTERSSRKKLSARDRELEFRSDPSLGTDLDRRMRDMAREGVAAQVIFPNILAGARAAITSLAS